MYVHAKGIRNPLYRMFFAGEHALKELLFDCSSCGQCIARSTAFTCTLRCPKNLRNGPCGGSMDGKCEVDRDNPCIWNLIITRAERFGLEKTLDQVNPAIDWELYGTSAWVNLAKGKITHKGFSTRSPVLTEDEADD